MPARPNPKMPTSDEEFLALLDEHGGVSAVSRALGVPVSTVSVRRTRILKKNGGVLLRQPTYPRAPEWGIGGPVLVPPTKASGDELVVGIFDIHYPHHDKDLWASILRLLEALQPDVVVLGGDVYDLSMISRWEARRRDATPIGILMRKVQEDLDAGRTEIVHAIRARCPNAVIRYVEGNHDERLRMWLMGDHSVEGVEMANEMMRFEEDGVIWHPRCGFKLRKHFLVRHGETTVANPAKAEQEKTRCGGWIGHGHRKRMWHEVFPEVEERYETWMAPVVCRNDYDYGPGGSGLAPWPQGILVGTFSVEDEYDYHVETASWWKGSLAFRGKRY